MVIDMRQTASNIAQRFEVCCNDTFTYVGELGRFFKIQPIHLGDVDGAVVLKATFQMVSLKNYLPFGTAAGQKQHRRNFRIYRDERPIASLSYCMDGVLQNYYRISIGERTYSAYWRACGDNEYVMIYYNQQQVGMVETNLSVEDYKYYHRLYLLDEFADDREVMILFLLYYSNYHFSKRFHMSKNTTIVKSWSFTKYSDKIDLSWKEKHFRTILEEKSSETDYTIPESDSSE